MLALGPVRSSLCEAPVGSVPVIVKVTAEILPPETKVIFWPRLVPPKVAAVPARVILPAPPKVWAAAIVVAAAAVPSVNRFAFMSVAICSP